MRILFSGAFNPAFEALPEALVAALRSLGHGVEVFDHRAFLLPGRLRDRVPFLDRCDRRRLNAALLGRVRSFRPDQLVVNQGMTLDPATVRRVREAGIRTVDWFSDYPAEFERGLEAAPAYDAFHIASSWAAARHREAGHANAHWLPFGCDPRAHGALASTPSAEVSRWSRRRIVMVGSHYPERQILLRHLRGLPVDIWGPGWERAAADPHVAPMIRGGALRPGAWRDLYAGAAAVLNIHYGAFGPPFVSGDMANTRVFEIPACGALQIVDRQRDILRLFREEEEFLGFGSGEELRVRVEQVLADPAAFRGIASAGRRTVLSEHTYVDRVRVLLGETAFAPDLVDAGIGGTAARLAAGAAS
jgi:spore maturation protein CgeB